MIQRLIARSKDDQQSLVRPSPRHIANTLRILPTAYRATGASPLRDRDGQKGLEVSRDLT